MRPIKTYADGSYFAYCGGNFDAFQVIYYDQHGQRQSFMDVDALARLQYLASVYSVNIIWHFFDIIFTLVSDNAKRRNQLPYPSPDDFNIIARLANFFAHEEINPQTSVLNIEKVFDYFYLTMISECHRPHTRLYHRVKRLAVYQVLFLHMTPWDADNFARGKSLATLRQVLNQYGI